MLFLGAFIILVAVFLLGITLMRAGLFILGSKKMEQWLKKMTNTPTKGMFAGIAMTGVLQSSSAVMVIMIGLVSTRLLLFPQTIGIILGSNIGTTLTLQFITFNLTNFIIPFAGIGLICLLFKITWVKSLGFISIGLASIFAAMHGFERLADPLMDIPFMQKLLLMMGEHVLYALIIGIIITSIIQSSTVVTGIAMSFLNAGIFPIGNRYSHYARFEYRNMYNCIIGKYWSRTRSKTDSFRTFMAQHRRRSTRMAFHFLFGTGERLPFRSIRYTIGTCKRHFQLRHFPYCLAVCRTLWTINHLGA